MDSRSCMNKLASLIEKLKSLSPLRIVKRTTSGYLLLELKEAWVPRLAKVSLLNFFNLLLTTVSLKVFGLFHDDNSFLGFFFSHLSDTQWFQGLDRILHLLTLLRLYSFGFWNAQAVQIDLLAEFRIPLRLAIKAEKSLSTSFCLFSWQTKKVHHVVLLPTWTR